jgi:prepilin-type processing-associated H-X9-DG protein
MNKRKGFTAIEVAAVVATGAFLIGGLMPVLAADRDKAKQAQCSAQMRQWGFAMLMYADDYQQLPWYAPKFDGGYIDYNKTWFGVVEPYLSGRHTAKVDNSMFLSKIRQCPGGKYDSSQAFNGVNHWNCWIGVNYGAYDATKAPILYGSNGSTPTQPCKLSNVKHPESWLMMLDTQYSVIYTPIMTGWRFDTDMDGDGLLDTCSGTMTIYNGANPKIHNNGCNVALTDGHVEWVSFKDLWKLDSRGKVTHTFWYND